MNTAYLTAIAASGAAAMTHIGLVNGSATAVGGARQSITWTQTAGLIRPNADKVFNVAQGETVAGWQGYSASTAGTAYGVTTLTSVEFTIAGTYTLQASGTGVNHAAA